MTSWQDRLERSREDVDPGWDDARSELALVALVRKKKRRTRIRTAALATVAVAGLAWTTLHIPEPASAPTVVVQHQSAESEPSDARLVHLIDGSRVLLLSPEARVHNLNQQADLIALDVAAGRYRFDVEQRPSRAFVVGAGGVSVTVLGTRCVLELGESAVHVFAERGSVHIEAHGQIHKLNDGQRAEVPLLAPTKTKHVLRNDTDKTKRWKTLAERGGYDAAFAVLKQKSTPKVRDRTEELLLAADVARFSGHPRSAVPYLEQVLKKHRKDPRASLAAFTLGRVWLRELGQPRQAADAFADARAIAPDHPLAEDALAREVEAWHQAGETQRAQQRATEYLLRYPDGRRVAHVRRLGDLD